MNHTRKTTEFSTHLSRSRVRRYLHEQLEPRETQEVEIHLANCAQCSASLVNYIETEEPDQHNAYVKRLKGKLKEQKITKRRSLSSLQIRALRATAAVIALLIFSFFAVKTIINKDVTGYHTDNKTVPVKKKPAMITQKAPSKSESTGNLSKKKSDDRIAQNQTSQSRKSTKPTTPSQSAEPKKAPAKKKAPVKKEAAKTATTTSQPKSTAPTTVTKPTVKKEESPKTAEPAKEKESAKEAAPTVRKVAPVEKIDEAKIEEDAAEKKALVPVKALPTIERVDNNKNTKSPQPAGSAPVPVVPIPSNKLK